MSVYVSYSDAEHSVRVFIDFKDNKIVINENSNVNVIVEGYEATTELEQHEGEKPSKPVRERALLKNEVLRILESRNAFDESSALSIDEIVDIAQYEKDHYPILNKIIENQGVSYTKKILALVIAVLRRRGKVKKYEVKVDDKTTAKYYIVRR